MTTQSQRSVKVSFVLDELARTENLSVNQAELSYFVADQAQRMGVSPEYFARQLTESGQISVAITEVLRGKAATVAAEQVKVTDEAGNEIDVKAQIEALNADVDAMLAAQAAEQATRGRPVPRATSRSATCRSTWPAPSRRTRHPRRKRTTWPRRWPRTRQPRTTRRPNPDPRQRAQPGLETGPGGARSVYPPVPVRYPGTRKVLCG